MARSGQPGTILTSTKHTYVEKCEDDRIKPCVKSIHEQKKPDHQTGTPPPLAGIAQLWPQLCTYTTGHSVAIFGFSSGY
jgi:hypothetical protein